MKRLAVRTLLLLLLLARQGLARDAEADRNMAQSLFERGRALMAQHRYAQACPLFAESQRLDHGGGTLLNLALCHEKEGKLATAYLEYQDARSEAIQEDRSDRRTFARERIDKLESVIERVSFSLAPGADLPGLKIRVDGVAVPRVAWAVPTPLDPGTHQIEVVAPNYQPFKRTIHIDAAGHAHVIVVKPLDPLVRSAAGRQPAGAGRKPAPRAAPASPSPDTSPTRVSTASWHKTAGWVALGVGAAGLVVGGVEGAIVLHKHSELSSVCPGGACPASERSPLDAYHTAGTVSTIGFVVGAVGVGAGVTFLLTAPKREEAYVAPYLGFGAIGARGRF